MGRYESAFWLSDGWGASRRERASGTYRPYVPDPIAGADIRLTAGPPRPRPRPSAPWRR